MGVAGYAVKLSHSLLQFHATEAPRSFRRRMGSLQGKFKEEHMKEFEVKELLW